MRGRHGKNHLLLLIALLLVGACASMQDWASRVDWEGLSVSDIPGEEAYPDAGSILIREEGRMEIIGSPENRTSLFSYHVIEKILNESGHDRLNIAIPFSEGTTVEAVAARTISPDGRITVVAPDEVYDVTYYPNFIFYSDQRARMFTMPAVEDGSIVEYRYRLRIRGSTFWHGWDFQQAQPTLYSRFELVAPAALNVLSKTVGGGIEVEVDEGPSNMKNTYVWEARDVPPVKLEYGMPPLRDVVSRVVIAPIGIETWDDVAVWYSELAGPQMRAGAGIRELVARLTEGADSDVEKLRRIYDWTLSHVRYIAVQIGQGNYRPHAAEDVQAHRYGDCKDMTTLVCAMAGEAGIDTRQVLVSTRANGLVDTTLASMLHFNHAVAYSPSVDGGVLMDATDKGCPFGQVSWYLQGMPVFVVGDGTGEWIDVPWTPADGNRTEVEWIIVPDDSGGAWIEGTTRLRGCHAHEVREGLIYASPDERTRWMESYLNGHCSGVDLESFGIEGLKPAEDPLVLRYAFRANAFTGARGEALVWRPGEAVNFDLSDQFRTRERVHPIRFKFKGVRDYSMKLVLPEGWITDDAPMDEIVSSPFGEVRREWSLSGDTLTCRHVYRMEATEVLPEEYGMFRDFLDTVRRKDMEEIVVRTDGE